EEVPRRSDEISRSQLLQPRADPLGHLTLLCVSNVDKSLVRKPSALFDAILFVAAAAIILANVAERRLEGIYVLHARVGGLRIAAKLGKPCFEVVHVLPDFRTGAVWIIRGRLVN